MKRFERILALLIALFGIALAVVSLRIGVAAWLAKEPWEFLVAYEKAGRRAERSALVERYEQVGTALRWRSDDPDLHELSARYAMAIAPLDAAAQSTWHDSALDHLRASTARRPRWPYAWASLALVKAAREEFDAELETAVVNAIRFGPQEKRVHRQVASLFVTAAPEERPAIAAEIEKRFVVEFAKDPRAWVDRADRMGKGEAICARGDLPDAAVARCVQLRWR